ncbi:hypothetical protein E1A91_D09G165800v1, partial [Gossypium mustelinum]
VAILGFLSLRLIYIIEEKVAATAHRFRRTKYGPKKEGHFAVVTVKGGEKKRFILELKYLRKPEFLRLLEQAKEEYEFQQEGVLILPSQPKSCRIF